jgi:tetratricopeptide (TPR) repeat protein
VVAVREAEAKKLGGWSNVRYYSLTMQIERVLEIGNFPQALEEAQALLDKCLTAGEKAYLGAEYDIADMHFLLGRILLMGGASEAALPLLTEACQRFQRLAVGGNVGAARMASVSLTEKGDCLSSLGRLEEAADTYKENISMAEKLKYDRQIAVGKVQLGTVRMLQKRYGEALQAYHEALKIFTDLGEPASVATIWHQKGMVHEEAGQFDDAEGAYRQSLQMSTQQKNSASEARSLVQLGNLYNKMGRLEEAVIFYSQAADKYIEIGDLKMESVARNNLADTFIKLKRYAETRQEIRRAIECKKPYGHAAEPWNVWNLLYQLEQTVGNPAAAAEARAQAIQLYLAYRREGGENHNPGGRLCAAFREAVQGNQAGEMAAVLGELGRHPEIDPSIKVLIPKLQAILAGTRDPQLAADPELHYTDAAELLFLLERL